MLSRPRIAVLIPLACLLGCSPGTTSPPTDLPNLAGNWLIQSGTAITSSGTTILLAGALQNQGSQVTGTFHTTALCGTPSVLSYTGSIDSSGNLTLASLPIPSVNLKLLVPANSAMTATGTVQAFGYDCALAFSSPAVGVQIPPLTGTFSGPVTVSGLPPPPAASGTVSVTLTQSATPNSDGPFPLTGTIAYSTAGCSVSIPVTGIINGLWLTLASGSSIVPGQNSVSLAANTNPGASQLAASTILFTPGPCSASSSSTTYTGTLTRQ